LTSTPRKPPPRGVSIPKERVEVWGEKGKIKLGDEKGQAFEQEYQSELGGTGKQKWRCLDKGSRGASWGTGDLQESEKKGGEMCQQSCQRRSEGEA